jgi:hypothetical protein
MSDFLKLPGDFAVLVRVDHITSISAVGKFVTLKLINGELHETDKTADEIMKLISGQVINK